MKKLFLFFVALMMTVGIQAQNMKGRVYYNGDMSVSQLLSQRMGESPEARQERELVLNEIFTMSITVEFRNSEKLKVKTKIIADNERAKELGVDWGNRNLWQAQLKLAAQSHNYWSKYKIDGNTVIIEDGTQMLLNEDGSELTLDDHEMKATLKRIR